MTKSHIGARSSEPIRDLARHVLRGWRYLRNKARILVLRGKGCEVDWTAWIHPGAIVERSGGEIVIGPRTSLDAGAIIRAMGGRVRIGADCSVNAYSFLSGGGGLEISDHVMIASHVSIYASNHVFADTSKPMNAQGLDLKGIVIESDVWVGTGVRILDGVRIGTGSVLAAGAVVTKSTEPYSVSGGVPARQIASRVSVGSK